MGKRKGVNVAPEKEQPPSDSLGAEKERPKRYVRGCTGFPRPPEPVVKYDDRTKQSFKDECDIGKILAQYTKTGIITHLNRAQAVFTDVSEMGDYRQALEQVEAARVLFMELPSAVRAKFNNDAAQFLDFATDPENLEEMREMGLAPVISKHPDVVQPGEGEDVPSDPEPGKQAPEGGAVAE